MCSIVVGEHRFWLFVFCARLNTYYMHTLYITYIQGMHVLYACMQVYTYLAGRLRWQRGARQQLWCVAVQIVHNICITTILHLGTGTAQPTARTSALKRASASRRTKPEHNVAMHFMFVPFQLHICVEENSNLGGRQIASQGVILFSKSNEYFWHACILQISCGII